MVQWLALLQVGGKVCHFLLLCMFILTVAMARSALTMQCITHVWFCGGGGARQPSDTWLAACMLTGMGGLSMTAFFECEQ